MRGCAGRTSLPDRKVRREYNGAHQQRGAQAARRQAAGARGREVALLHGTGASAAAGEGLRVP